jgi:sarcosine/dimethylglycine N-methyltransferase
MVHSSNRDQVVAEAFRVLKPGGHFIFTDLMQDDSVPEGELGPVLDRIHLDSLGSFKFYWEEARKNGFELMSINNMSQHLVTHYDRVRQETENQYDDIVDACGKEYIDRMIQGLNHWVRAGNKGHLNWGILHFKKA